MEDKNIKSEDKDEDYHTKKTKQTRSFAGRIGQQHTHANIKHNQFPHNNALHSNVGDIIGFAVCAGISNAEERTRRLSNVYATFC